MKKATDYYYRLVPSDLRSLLVLSGLPLVDGFFLAFLSTGMWQDSWQAVAFGLNAFSGGGCFFYATMLAGSWKTRLVKVLLIYSTVAAGAVIVAGSQTALHQMVPTNLHLFTGIFLLGLGLTVSGIPRLLTLAKWTGFDAAIKVMLIASLIQGIYMGFNLSFAIDSALLPQISLAVVSGFALTSTGMLLSRPLL